MIESSRGKSPADEDQRLRIVVAMVDSCAEKTCAATTIGDVVAAAHISRTTFYREFDDKRACFDAALEYCTKELWSWPRRGPLGGGNHRPKKVRAATAAVLDLLAALLQLAHLLVGEAVAVDPAVVERYRDLVVPALGPALGRRKGPDTARPAARLRSCPVDSSSTASPPARPAACRSCCRNSSTSRSRPSPATTRRSRRRRPARCAGRDRQIERRRSETVK